MTFVQIGGQGSVQCFQSLYENILYPSLEEISVTDTGIELLPSFISSVQSLKTLKFRCEKFTEIPIEIFEMTWLQTLSFEKMEYFKIISDKIKTFENLEHFDLWGASIDYLSPELFLLPKINLINFAYCRYTPTEEVTEALKKFLDKPNSHFSSWGD